MNTRKNILVLISTLIIALSACEKEDSLNFESLSGYWVEKETFGDLINVRSEQRYGAWINFRNEKTLLFSPSCLMDICYVYNYSITDNNLYLWTDLDPETKDYHSIYLENGELTIYSLFVGIPENPSKTVFVRAGD